jgi:hypothetical protein
MNPFLHPPFSLFELKNYTTCLDMRVEDESRGPIRAQSFGQIELTKNVDFHFVPQVIYGAEADIAAVERLTIGQQGPFFFQDKAQPNFIFLLRDVIAHAGMGISITVKERQAKDCRGFVVFGSAPSASQLELHVYGQTREWPGGSKRRAFENLRHELKECSRLHSEVLRALERLEVAVRDADPLLQTALDSHRKLSDDGRARIASLYMEMKETIQKHSPHDGVERRKR